MRYVDGLVLTVLRDALTADVGTIVPADLMDRLPYVVARTIGGTSIHPKFAQQATVRFDAWAVDRRTAGELAIAARAALLRAYELQTVTSDGHIAGFDDVEIPSELREPSQPDGVYRFVGTVTLTVR